MMGNDLVNITHVKVSPNDPTTIYLGTEADIRAIGSKEAYLVKVLDANSSSPTYINITGSNFPNRGNISCIDIEKGNPNHLIVSFYNYSISSVFESIDGGVSWVNLDVGPSLPNIPIRWVIFMPQNPNWAMLATEMGIFATDNLNGSSTTWANYNIGLANVRVNMLVSRDFGDVIFAATHGRGLYSTDVQPSPDFYYNPTCHGGVVDLFDNSLLATSWEWDFDSDGIIDATTQNPQACFPGPNITLKINNGAFSITKPFAYDNSCQEILCNAPGQNRLLDKQLEVFQASPNPFSHSTNIKVLNSVESQVEISVYDIYGRKIHSLQPAKLLPSGSYTYTINENILTTAGLYYVKLVRNEGIKTISILYNPQK